MHVTLENDRKVKEFKQNERTKYKLRMALTFIHVLLRELTPKEVP
jgi:hypothetical protein